MPSPVPLRHHPLMEVALAQSRGPALIRRGERRDSPRMEPLLANGPNSLAPVYFSTAAQIFQWQPTSANPIMVSTVALAPRIVTNEARLLVGFDNGPWTYWPEFDANPQGGRRGNVYNFQYWQYIDAMYYYVHTLAAVPPVMWINAAHRNGVRVFSAVTADYDGGGEQFNALFSSADIAAQQLYRLAATYGFDGWIVDVENGATPNDDVRRAMQLLKTMLLPNGRLVEAGYYEAGQYTINDQTYPFFEAGTFFQSDYTAAQGLPVQTYGYLSQLGQVAARFATHWSVYVYNYPGDGADGLFNGHAWLDAKGLFAQLGQAVNAQGDPRYYQSLGIYAPDWTMYGGLDSTSAPLPSREQFHTTDRLFWVGNNPRVTARGTLQTDQPAVSNFIRARSTVTMLPFVTRFNTGEGSFFAIDGNLITVGEWNHLSCQDLLPTWLIPTLGPANRVLADFSYTMAYDGGSALSFQGVLNPGERVEYALYLVQARLGQNTRVAFSYNIGQGRVLPYVKLEFVDGASVSIPGIAGLGWSKIEQNLGPAVANKVLIRITLGWVNETDIADSFSAALGELRLAPPPSFPPPGLQTPKLTGNLLTWAEPPSTPIWYYNVFHASETALSLAGRAFTTAYDLSAALFPTPSGGSYLVQPVTTAGDYTPLPELGKALK